MNRARRGGANQTWRHLWLTLASALGLLKRLSDAHLYVVSKCGHSMQLEATNEFNNIVLAFIDGSLMAPAGT